METDKAFYFCGLSSTARKMQIKSSRECTDNNLVRNNPDQNSKIARLRLRKRLAALTGSLSARSTLFLHLLPMVAVSAFAATASAEYRVFQLRIENTKTKELRLVESTLDPIQYPYYNTVSADERISYTETWRCFGRTGDFTPFCPNPKAQPIVENPPANP